MLILLNQSLSSISDTINIYVAIVTKNTIDFKILKPFSILLIFSLHKNAVPLLNHCLQYALLAHLIKILSHSSS